MTVTHPHLLEKAVRSETTHWWRVVFVADVNLWGLCEDIAYIHAEIISRIRADYKRRVQKKGRRRMAA